MATEENLTGKEFAGCKVINKIGQGGMGTVYRAHHKALNKTVCVKILAKELANDKRNLEFFLREARSAAKLDHPNIVHVYNFGKENHNYFIVMSFIDGKSLQDMVVKDGPMPVEKATKFMCELLDGLAHAHSRGIIHRDIKPSNILVDKKGRSYLVDFGLARSVSEEKELTQAGEMIGTAYFMSPEQCLAKEVDNRADIYAVGATYFYLLTGKYPFDGKTSVEVMHKHIGNPVPDPLLINPSIPRWAAMFIERTMKKKPEERYVNAEEARNELLDYSTGKKLVPTPGGEIILDLSSKIHDPVPDLSFSEPGPAAKPEVSSGGAISIPSAPQEFTLGSDGGASSFSNSSYSGAEGVTVDWNSGETINAAPPPPVHSSADPSMDLSGSINIEPEERSTSAGKDLNGFQNKATAAIMTDSYEATLEQQAEEEKEEKEKKKQEQKEKKKTPEKKSRVITVIHKSLKTLAHLALLFVASFSFVLAGACGSGASSLGNSFSTNAGGAMLFTIAGLVITGIAFLFRPKQSPVRHIVYIVICAVSAFMGGAFISAAENTDISTKLITAVSMIAQNSSGHLSLIFAVVSFMIGAELTGYKNIILKLAGAAFYLLSTFLVFSYVRVGHEYFGINGWGIAALIAVLLSVFYAVTDSRDKILGPKFFVIAAYCALLLMICIPNINRAAENAFQKSNKEWDVFRAAQKEDGFRYPKELEPKPQKPLAELKDEEKSLYFSKEKDKLAYSFTEACGLIPFALCMAFLSTLSLCGKMFEFLENKPENF